MTGRVNGGETVVGINCMKEFFKRKKRRMLLCIFALDTSGKYTSLKQTFRKKGSNFNPASYSY